MTSKQRAVYGFAFFVLFVALWAWATLGGYVSKTFLANPLTMLQEGWVLLTKHGFLFDIGMTIWRVVGGFVLAALIAVPLGVLMGAYKPIEAFLEPFVSFARYLPASAFIPLLILWAGIGETAEAAGDLHRLGVPDHPDGRRQRRQHAARPGRGGLHAGRHDRGIMAPRAAVGRAPRSPRSCGSCWAGPGPT